MPNTTVGKLGSAVTGLAVFAFAVSMIFGLFSDTLFASCLSSMFIAIGFLPFMAALYTVGGEDDKKACGLAGIGFGAVYIVLVLLVYYAECTTIHLNPNLSEEVLSVIDYGHLGSLFFHYDLLGYGFMALSTLLIGSVLKAENREEKWFKTLLMVHGIFFVSCFFVPMFPVFTAGTGSATGTILLEVWCAYFLPICVLGYRYFARRA
ncbi:MAG: hypothetical protein IJ049_05430 [Oscillospiraceae bacterium]|nr:hypothetical protein [Oscillospiraceae bacterium]